MAEGNYLDDGPITAVHKYPDQPEAAGAALGHDHRPAVIRCGMEVLQLLLQQVLEPLSVEKW